jgi:hypothetical protein
MTKPFPGAAGALEFPSLVVDGDFLPAGDPILTLESSDPLQVPAWTPVGAPLAAPPGWQVDLPLIEEIIPVREEAPVATFVDSASADFTQRTYKESLPFQILRSSFTVPQVELSHPYEKRVIPEIPALSIVGVPEEW